MNIFDYLSNVYNDAMPPNLDDYRFHWFFRFCKKEPGERSLRDEWDGAFFEIRTGPHSFERTYEQKSLFEKWCIRWLYCWFDFEFYKKLQLWTWRKKNPDMFYPLNKENVNMSYNEHKKEEDVKTNFFNEVLDDAPDYLEEKEEGETIEPEANPDTTQEERTNMKKEKKRVIIPVRFFRQSINYEQVQSALAEFNITDERFEWNVFLRAAAAIMAKTHPDRVLSEHRGKTQEEIEKIKKEYTKRFQSLENKKSLIVKHAEEYLLMGNQDDMFFDDGRNEMYFKNDDEELRWINKELERLYNLMDELEKAQDELEQGIEDLSNEMEVHTQIMRALANKIEELGSRTGQFLKNIKNLDSALEKTNESLVNLQEEQKKTESGIKTIQEEQDQIFVRMEKQEKEMEETRTAMSQFAEGLKKTADEHKELRRKADQEEKSYLNLKNCTDELAEKQKEIFKEIDGVKEIQEETKQMKQRADALMHDLEEKEKQEKPISMTDDPVFQKKQKEQAFKMDMLIRFAEKNKHDPEKMARMGRAILQAGLVPNRLDTRQEAVDQKEEKAPPPPVARTASICGNMADIVRRPDQMGPQVPNGGNMGGVNTSSRGIASNNYNYSSKQLYAMSKTQKKDPASGEPKSKSSPS